MLVADESSVTANLAFGLLLLSSCGACPQRQETFTGQGQPGTRPTSSPVSPSTVTTATDLSDRAHLGAWSEPVNGLRARLRAYPADTHRTSAYTRIEVEFENVSDRGNPIEFLWNVDEIFEFKLLDGNAEVEKYFGPYDQIRVNEYWLGIPRRGQVRHDLTTTGWGFHPGTRDMMVGTPGFNAWSVPLGDTRDLLLTGRMTVPAYETPANEQERLAWSGELILPAVLLPKNRLPEWRSGHGAFSEHMNRVRPGWSETQLLDYAGTPDGTETREGPRAARWFYHLDLPSDLRTQFTVDLAQGVVLQVNSLTAQIDVR